MLCRSCRRQLPRGGDACALCGTPRERAQHAACYALVLPDGTRTPLRSDLALGRAAGNTVRLDDPAVSRHHARLCAAAGSIEVQDLASSAGTFLDGHRIRGVVVIRDGQRLRLGDTHLRVERERGPDEAARTVVVPVGATLRVAAVGNSSVQTGAPLPARPRLRSGWALKRQAASEGPQRHVLSDLRGQGFLRFSDREAELLALLDGTHTVAELAAHAQRGHGPDGIKYLASLLAELADCGLLAGSERDASDAPRGLIRALLRPRELGFRRAPEAVERIYLGAGFRLFTRPAMAVVSAVIAIGAAAFLGVLATGETRPLRVGGALTAGALAFLVGRAAVVVAHELGHGLTLASFGRRPRRVGIKFVLGIPYAFVDTSEAWFEPRRRRIAVSAAGPATDAALAGLCSLLALACAGAARDVAFQLALGAYTGLLLNLNPLLDRDGYHVLVDLLGTPNLRRRAQEELRRRLAGRPGTRADSRPVAVYGAATLGWSCLTAAFVAVATMDLAGRVTGGASPWLWPLAGLPAALALTPAALVVVRGLRERWTTRLEPRP